MVSGFLILDEYAKIPVQIDLLAGDELIRGAASDTRNFRSRLILVEDWR